MRSGIPGVTDEINLRIDSWGRIGAVYMLAGPKFDRLAGNVTNWPFDGAPAEPWPEFRIESIEPGQRSVHPVRAAVRKLPNGDWLLVGTDMSQDERYVRTFQIATLWGIGLSILAAAHRGILVQLPAGAPRRGRHGHLRADHVGRAGAPAAGGRHQR